MSIHTESPQEWITNKIIIILTARPMKTAPITKKTVQPMNLALAPTQPMKTAPYIPKNLQRITNKRLWIITLQTRHQEC